MREANLFPSETQRAPRLSVLADGTPLAGAIEAEVASNSFHAADRFQVRLALDADPHAAAFWAAAGQVMLEVRAGLAGQSASLIQGEVDQVRVDPIRRVVSLDGRDLTARLIAARTQESFVNRTASEVAEILANRHGLQPEVTRTTTKVGRFYQDEHDRITLGQFSRAITEWDLLTWLARLEGFEVFVRGTTLTFGPIPPGARLVPLAITEAMDVRLERSLTLARDIEVVVKSWNSQRQFAFTKTARSPAVHAGKSSSVQRHVLVRPNLTEDAALKLAQTALAELTRHRIVLRARMPGELALAPRDILLLRGSASGFDRGYVVDEVVRHLSPQHGFTQHVRARTDAIPAQTTPPGDNRAGTKE